LNELNSNQLQNEINEIKTRYSIVSELSGLLIYDYDISTGTIKWEGAIESMTGFTHDEYRKVNLDVWASMVHPDDQTAAINKLQESIQRKGCFIATYRMMRKDSSYLYVQERGTVIESGSQLRMVGVIEDIHLRRLAEDALKASEKKFHLFYDISNEALFYILSDSKKLIDANRKFFDLFEYEVEETDNLTAHLLFPEDYRERIFQWFEREATTSMNVVCLKKDGSGFPALMRHFPVVYKGNNVIFISILDVSIYKEAEMLKEAYQSIRIKNTEIEHKKKEIESALSTIQATQKQLIFSEKMAALGQIVAGIAHEINNPIGAIKASGEILGENLANIVYFNLDALTLINSLSEKEREKFLQWILISSVSDNFVFGTKLREKKKNLKQWLIEEGVFEPESLVDNILDNNMDNNLKEVLFLFKHAKWRPLLEYAFLNVSIFQNLRTIENSISRVSKIIYALKNFSHINQDETMSKTNIAKTIDVVITIHQNLFKKGITLNKKYHPIPEIFCYPDALHQVWTNLIYNAMQAMSFKGILTIGLKELEKFIQITIEDTGGGIPLEIRERIFEPFFTTKPPGEGSGMGLGIVKKIIDKHSGRIEVDTSEKGTIFSVFIPKLLTLDPAQ
jgi:PAS domain S-box-containing protein